MNRQDFWNDQEKARKLVEELKHHKSIVDGFERIRDRLEESQTLLEILRSGEDGELERELHENVDGLTSEMRKFEITAMLNGPYDRNNAFLNLHAGAGGTEACDWVAMLYRMYTRWLDENGYRWREVDALPDDEAGFRRVTIRVEGEYAYGYLQCESGVHRLVRISPFDASKRRHTSFASVDCVPEVEDVDVEIDPSEIKVETFRSSGPGGQHANMTDSAVRIIHIPTGIVVQCQNERSQHQNRRTAMAILKGKLTQLAELEKQKQIEAERGSKGEIAWGNQIRSYVLHPYTLVKDHRTGVETADARKVLDGDITPFIEAFLRSRIKGRFTEGGK